MKIFHFSVRFLDFWYFYKKKPIGLLSIKTMFPPFLRLPDRKVLGSILPYISTSQTEIRNVCLSFIVCQQPAKIPYVVQNYPKVVRFSFLKTLCLGKPKTMSYVWKNITKKTAFVFVNITSLNFHRMCV